MRSTRLPGVARWTLGLAAAGFASAAAAQLRPTAAPSQGTVTLTRGFLPDPRYVAVPLRAPALSAQVVAGPACRGFVTAQPNVVLELRGPGEFFRIYATSTADITLVVRTPDGQTLCSDDAFGTNPAVDGNLAAGRYTIWVGAARAGTTATATLAFTELEESHP